MIKKSFCGVLALVMMTGILANAAEPAGIEVRKRNSIGRLGLVKVQPVVKTEADGTMAVSFHVSAEGTYILVYTSGPKRGKAATRINVIKPGPVTAKVKG